MKRRLRKQISLIFAMVFLLGIAAGPVSAYETAVSSVEFVDLEEHWATESMTQLIEMGVVNGYAKEAKDAAGDTYNEYYIKPEQLITRAEFATILAKALNLQASSTTSDLGDISGHWAEGYIKALYKKGVVVGYDSGSSKIFKPEARITRGEIVTMLVKSLNNQEPVAEAVYFADVDSKDDHWAFDFIQKAVALEIVKGYKADNTFKPDGKAKRSEVMTMLVKFLNNDWTPAGLPSDEELVAAATYYQQSIESVLKTTPDKDLESPFDWSPAYEHVTGGEKLALDEAAEAFNNLARYDVPFAFEIKELTEGKVLSKSDHTAVVKQYAKMVIKLGPEELTLEGDVYSMLMKENGKWLIYSNPELEQQDTNSDF